MDVRTNDPLLQNTSVENIQERFVPHRVLFKEATFRGASPGNLPRASFGVLVKT